jgi:muramidase (phage lysozyme)
MVQGKDKCTLDKNALIKIQAQPKEVSDHYLVNLQKLIPGCSFSKGYVFRDHVADTSLPKAPRVPTNLKAFLDVIAYAEGTRNEYNYSFTHARFNSYRDHPRALYCSFGLCSDAAGRYQFLSTTWDELASQAGLSDFSPANQDLAAIQLLINIGAYSTVLNANSFGVFSDALYLSSGTWASLPGSPHGQPIKPAHELWDVYTRARW